FIKKTEVTSKRKKIKVAADSIPPPTVDGRAETLRRGLLALVTALIVARPLVLGEDPGLKDPLSSASGLLLSMLWFVAAVAYAACRCLLAAVLATGVSLSAHAVYQSTYEMRQHRQLAEDPQQLREAGTKLFGPMEPDDPRLENLKQRLLMDHVFATYAHPNAFAGYLALLVPAAFGWVLAAWLAVRKGIAAKAGWQVLLTAGCALLLILALWLTHSRGAILGVMIVGLAAFFVRPKANSAG